MALPPALSGDRVAQRAVEPVQDGGVQQEVADLAGLALQHLLGQVVDDVAVVSREAGDEPAASSRPCIDRAASCSAAIHPSVRPSSAATSAAVSSQAHHLVEVRRSLVRCESQVGSPDLDQLAACPQPGQRHRRVSATGDHEVQPRRQVVEQERHRVLDLARVDQVVVVEHQHDVVAGRPDVVEQRGEHHLDRGRLRRGKQLQLVRADPRRRRPQRGDHVAPEGHRVVVAGVERQPCSGLLAGRCRRPREPLREQPRLAEAGRCGDEGQLRRGTAVQLLDQPRTRHQPWSWPGPIELRLQQAAFASASPVASVDLWSAHLAHCSVRVAVTTAGAIACLKRTRASARDPVWLLHHEETAMPDVPRTELSSHSAHPHRPPTVGMDELVSRDHGRGSYAGSDGGSSRCTHWRTWARSSCSSRRCWSACR